VDGAWREIWARLGQDEGGMAHSLRWHLVCDVDDGGARVDAENDPLHRANVAIGLTEVSGEGDNAAW
jgi:hypothetical protein